MTRKQIIEFLDKELDNYMFLDGGYQEHKPGGELLLKKLEDLDVLNPELFNFEGFPEVTAPDWEPEDYE